MTREQSNDGNGVRDRLAEHVNGPREAWDEASWQRLLLLIDEETSLGSDTSDAQVADELLVHTVRIGLLRGGISDLSPEDAQRLSNHFQTPTRLREATPEEILRVAPDVGVDNAERIRRLFLPAG